MANPETTGAVFEAPVAQSNQSSPLPWITLHDVLWLLYLYPLRGLARSLPRSVLYAMGRAADPLIQFHARRGKAKAVAWIRQTCGASADQAERLASRALTNKMFRLIDELLLLDPSSVRKIRCAGIEGLENLEMAMARGRGVVLLVGHFRANRIGLRYLAMKGHPALFVRNQRPPNKREGQIGRRFLNPRFVQLQKLAYPDQAYIQDPDCTLNIVRRLRSGGLVEIKIDGHGATHIVESSFLGRPWRVPAGFFEIVRFTGCAVVPMLCSGRSDSLKIRFDPMLEVEQSSARSESTAANAHRFLAAVEKQVIENPEEWTLWDHY